MIDFSDFGSQNIPLILFSKFLNGAKKVHNAPSYNC